jgi:hypothetical protein
MPRHRESVIEPGGLGREDAAAYLGISASLFDRLVDEKLMPPAKKLGGRKIWDRWRLDEAFDHLPGDEPLGSYVDHSNWAV